MKKRIVYVLLALLSFSACEKIEDDRYKPFVAKEEGKVMNDWGFIADFRAISVIVTNVSQNGYTMTLRDTVTAVLEDNIIDGAGYVVSYSSNENKDRVIPASITRNGNMIVFDATMTDCSYDMPYAVTPYVMSGNKTCYSGNTNIVRSRDDLKPKLSNMYYTIEMSSNAHTITPTIRTTELIDNFTFTFAGKTKEAVKQGDKYSVDFDLNELNVNQDYSGITLVASNSLGDVEGCLPYELSVTDYFVNGRYCIRSEKDGPNGNYITIGGVNWAKGNLVCENGVWHIDESPLNTPTTLQQSSFIQFFSFGDTTGAIDRFPTNERVNLLPQNIYGDINYDVVAANLGKGWRLPSYDEACILLYSTSHQLTQNGIILYPIQTRNRMFYSKTPITLKALPSDGLFLPFGGIATNGYYGSTVKYESIGAYMTGTKTEGIDDDLWVMSFAKQKYSWPQFYVSNLSDWNKDGGFYGYWRATTMKYKVRPVFAQD